MEVFSIIIGSVHVFDLHVCSFVFRSVERQIRMDRQLDYMVLGMPLLLCMFSGRSHLGEHDLRQKRAYRGNRPNSRIRLAHSADQPYSRQIMKEVAV